MKHILFLFLFICLAPKSFGQIESNIKFKSIPLLKVKTKKETPPPAVDEPLDEAPKINTPKIVPPNVLKETNIYGTKPKTDNSFEMGTTSNTFSMIKKNNFEHTIGEVYQEKMTKDLSKTLVRQGLKEDDSNLDRTDMYLGDFKTKSDFFAVKYRDMGLIDGDLINVYVNGKVLRSKLYLDYKFGEFRIPLNLGLNDIEFVVASTGTVGGNTAEIHVLDNVNRQITAQYWDNKALGVKIKMIVIRE